MNTTTASQSPSLSAESVCATDADMTFISSDNVLFKVHSLNLKYSSGKLGSNANIVKCLSEDSSTLELLFFFCYPRRHPDLEGFDIGTVLKLAEAAEKYQVFSAMSVCKLKIKYFLENAARTFSPAEATDDDLIQALIYGFERGYKDYLDKAAKLLHNVPLTTVTDKLPQKLLKPWIQYHEKKREKMMQALLEISVREPSPTVSLTSASFSSSQAPLTLSSTSPGPVFSFGAPKSSSAHAATAPNATDPTIVKALQYFSKNDPTMSSVNALKDAVSEALRDFNKSTLDSISFVNSRMSELPLFHTFVEM